MELIMPIIVAAAPALTAILGIIFTVGKALKSFKADTTLIDISNKLTVLSAENRELTRTNKLLLDRITKIENYADIKKGE